MRPEMSAPPYLIGAVLGGTTMSVLSAGGTFILEKTKPTPKTLTRDFILGSILLLLIMQILPDSTTRLIGWVTSFATLPAAAASASSLPAFLPGIGSMVEAVSAPAAAAVPSAPVASDELEVKVGVPRF